MARTGVHPAGQGNGLIVARNGCDMAQGFLFGRPVDPAEIEAMLRPESVLATSR